MNTTITIKRIRKSIIGMMIFLLIGSSAYGQIIIKLTPTITTQPKSADFCYNNSKTYQDFAASVSNATSLQWQYYYSGYVIIKTKSGEILPAGWYDVTESAYNVGTKTSKLRIMEPSGGWVQRSTSYRLKASNYYGTTYSNTVTLNVHTYPSIKTQPASATLWYPDSHTFTVSASSTATPSYQWQKYLRGQWLNLSKATGTSYTTSSSGSYRVRVSNSYCGSTYSNSATLTFNGIYSQPANQTICEDYSGSSVSFSVGSYNASKWQWQGLNPKTKVWTDIPGATSSTYTYDKPTGGWDVLTVTLRCRVTFPLGTKYSNTATFKVNNLPSITKQPVNESVNIGETATFSITASSTTTKSYQWYKDNVAIPGATGTTLTITGVTLDDAGSYKCTVTNSCGSKTSNTVQLAVVKLDWPFEWFSQKENSSPLNVLPMMAVSAPDKNTAWATINDYDHRDSLVYTLDGGETWNWTSTGHSPNYYWYSVFFTDNQHGWVSGYEMIAFTDNGGSTWAAWTDAALNDYFYDIHMVNNSKGWAVGENGKIYVTSNGGTDWGPQVSGTLSDLYEVHFYDDQHGVAIGDAGTIVYTKNGGANWSTATNVSINSTLIPSSLTMTNVFMVGPSTVYATSQNKFIKSTNGGETWDVVIDNRHGYDLSFVNENVGWVTSYSGRIYYTKNGGTTWYQQNTATSAYLYAICMVDEENGWAVGNDGAIQRTAFGGCKLPRVNLYEDKILCEGDNNRLRADTFGVSYARYEWSTGSTSGSIYANTEGKYYVDVFDLCEHKATDTVEVTVNPLPDAYAGEDVEICEGDTIQLNATGGLFYGWSSGVIKSAEADYVYISDPNIANPLVTAGPGNTTFTVSVEDANGCVKEDAMVLTVYEVPTAEASAPAFVCRNAEALVSYTGNASGAGSYFWDFGDGVAVVGDPNNYTVTWDTTGEKMILLAVNENGCYSDTARIPISVNPNPNSGFTMPEGICDSGYVQVLYDGVDSMNADYIWDFDGGKVGNGAVDEGPYQISWASEGTKTVSLQVNQDGCISEITSKQINVSYPYQGQEICLIMVDEDTEKNLLVWERTMDVGIQSYYIFRESASTEYEMIGEVSQGDYSQFVDSLSNPRNQTYRYKIAVLDTCSNVSELSDFHQPIFLQVNKGDGVYNLTWSLYLKESGSLNFKTQYILGGTDSTAMEIIDSVSGNAFQYTDDRAVAQENRYYYRIKGVLYGECAPSGVLKAGTGPYQHSLSNMDDNKLKETSVENMLSGVNQLRVFPNPFSERVNVEYNLEQSSDVKIEVYNLLGVRVLEVENSRQSPGSHSFNIRAEDLDGSSIYYLRFSVNGGSSVIKLIPAY